ncbi:uncharacterized protein E0L32_006205 [Thyridium curvatum]|uniref:Major facilitator superfamily (MFS) profile domain-containing protein n=1 Tax=Thyridium curvatum TaxID=1093900 RepID=A0A507ARN9_9PEZI|nr:uncharacterized protein E0L32_006205 [Thyridium curvatum]TPX13475.1 hypothetical protein E0L32_006205 [Thyridium curvatum]
MESKTLPTSPHETEVKESQSGSMAKSLETAENSQPEWTPEEEERLVRRVDLRVIPTLCVVMGLSLLDRANISSAYVIGMKKDLNMGIGGRYSLSLLVFFIAYGLLEMPSNLIIRRIGARHWLAANITAWGAMVLGMGFARHWATIAILRAFLGGFEACIALPGAVFVITSWYKTFETARRISTFFMIATVLNAFSGIASDADGY